jgi:hypothetical protein
MMSHDPELSPFCHRDMIGDEGQPGLITAIAQLANMAEQVGLSVNDLIDLLNRGLSVGQLVDAIGRAAREQHSPEVMA